MRRVVLERPIAIATLLVLLATPWLHPLAPRRFIQVLAFIALIAVARVVSHTSRESSRVVLAVLFGLLVLDRLALALEELPTVAQTIFLIELGLGIALAIRVVRRGGLLGRGRRWVRNGAQVALALLGSRWRQSWADGVGSGVARARHRRGGAVGCLCMGGGRRRSRRCSSGRCTRRAGAGCCAAGAWPAG